MKGRNRRIKQVPSTFYQRMQLHTKNAIAYKNEKQYLFKRCLIETVEYGQDAFISEGTLKIIPININQLNGNNLPQTTITDDRIFEGWRHFNVD